MLRLVKGLKLIVKKLKVREGKLSFSEKERGKVWRNYMERIMNEKNYWDRNVEVDAVEGPVVYVSREEVLQALNEKRKSPWDFRSITRVDCC